MPITSNPPDLKNKQIIVNQYITLKIKYLGAAPSGATKPLATAKYYDCSR